ncbi:MAG: alpha/beta hydrolase [Alphaproteobacteria bacterium]|nr:alpha/beta hydrolase [Alphaproteobacteria bacterium]
MNYATREARFLAELGAIFNPLVHWPLLTMTPFGRGMPVIVYPAFASDDAYTAGMRYFLEMKGYRTYGWEQGRNRGPRPHTLEAIKRQLADVTDKHGRKAALIGHSLGGVFARQLARFAPERVDRVITLGSPFGIAAQLDKATPATKKIFNFCVSDGADGDRDLLARDLVVPPPLPTTSIYSRDDELIHWSSSINPRGPLTENIEAIASSSHHGLAFSPIMLALMAERLAVSSEYWYPFNRNFSPFLAAYIPEQQAHLEDTSAVPDMPVYSAQELARLEAAKPNLGLKI